MRILLNIGFSCAIMAASFFVLAGANPIETTAFSKRNMCCDGGCRSCFRFGCNKTNCSRYIQQEWRGDANDRLSVCGRVVSMGYESCNSSGKGEACEMKLMIAPCV
ncbi:hypothetical protein F4820DRAFT_416965 [Hypoxylon rubiginosum]|uniref:Uncharacterized protein n=1 Tax=Hypoxylon rubiginosum TaxID=110542 RepID=A0ACB9Z4W2_9PEZI|nr:hypothetical protein F4820DRAFT_416965 [Hypoxylon rubiginosum]